MRIFIGDRIFFFRDHLISGGGPQVLFLLIGGFSGRAPGSSALLTVQQGRLSGDRQNPNTGGKGRAWEPKVPHHDPMESGSPHPFPLGSPPGEDTGCPGIRFRNHQLRPGPETRQRNSKQYAIPGITLSSQESFFLRRTSNIRSAQQLFGDHGESKWPGAPGSAFLVLFGETSEAFLFLLEGPFGRLSLHHKSPGPLE